MLKFFAILLFITSSCSLFKKENVQIVINDNKEGWYYLFFVIDTPLTSLDKKLLLIDSNYVFINVDTNKNLSSSNIIILNRKGENINHRAVLLQQSAHSIENESFVYWRCYIPNEKIDKSIFVYNGEINNYIDSIKSKGDIELIKLFYKLPKNNRQHFKVPLEKIIPK